MSGWNGGLERISCECRRFGELLFMKYYVKLIFRNMSDRSRYRCIHNRPNEDILSWEHCPILSSYFFKSYLANVTLSANKYKKRVYNVISMDGVCTELSGALFENLSHCAV